MCFDILNAVYYGKQMQQHAPSWNSFVEVNRTGERKSSEILFANTHQTVDSPRVTKKDTLWQKPSLSMCLKRVSLSNTYFCFVTTVKQRRHSPSKLFSEKTFVAKFEILKLAFQNFYLFSVLNFSGLIMSVWAFRWRKCKLN